MRTDWRTFGRNCYCPGPAHVVLDAHLISQRTDDLPLSRPTSLR